MGTEWHEVIYGVRCDVRLTEFSGKRCEIYTFTVPGWRECSVTGRRAAQRVIRGRLDPAVRNTLRIDEEKPEND
jgi:hypothetical protein